MKREWIAIAVIAVVLIVLFVVLGIGGKSKNVNFTEVASEQLPRELEADIIPQYRELERAMACIIDNQVYIMASRGEKPTAGYEVKITKVEIETKKQKNNMIVYASYSDPENSENMAQVKSYPICVVKADITGLPDTIELRTSF